MADRSVCTPLLAESDAQINTTSSPHAASVTDADKVINTKIDNTQVEGQQSEAELLKGLVTDDYCHVCEAVLLFESQRQSHYEGKKHAQKLKVFLQSKRAEKTKTECFGPQQQQQQQTMTTDKDHFCELCNMVFSSHIVAKSHYMGKVHSKNLRKQGLQPPVMDRHAKVQNQVLSVDPESTDQKSTPQSSLDKAPDLKASRCSPCTEVDVKDPNKHCVLCAASFNNPQMAFQHYNGRKHQRNQARQHLLRELGDGVQQANSLMCQMCGVQFNSVEMYQAHMQGNKHQIREKKVMDLCKSQHKAYNTFADELSDYIQIQKARGITQRPAALNPSDTKKEDEEYEEEEEVSNNDSIAEVSKPVLNFPPTSVHPHHSHVGCYNTAERWRPPYRGHHRLTRGFGFNYPPSVRPQSVSAVFTGQPVKRKRPRKQSSSSSDVTSSSSSYSSSYSSSTSDNDDPENSHREKRIRESRKDRDRRASHKDSNKEKRSKRQRREADKESKEQRRGESEESEGERGKKRRSHGKRRRQDKKSQAEDCEAEAIEGVMGTVMTEHVMDNKKESEEHIHTEVKVEEGDDGQDDSSKAKNRKEKKKPKKKVDTRTEEEKLWDDSILGF